MACAWPARRPIRRWRGPPAPLPAASPPSPRPPAPTPTICSPSRGPTENRAPRHLPILRRAIKARQRLTISYIDLNGTESHRDIRPLALEKSSRLSTLVAFCEARGDFRSFRVDRIVAVHETGEAFPNEPGRTLADYRARVAAETASRPKG